jgi:hypothetical protein
MRHRFHHKLKYINESSGSSAITYPFFFSSSISMQLIFFRMRLHSFFGRVNVERKFLLVNENSILSGSMIDFIFYFILFL